MAALACLATAAWYGGHATYIHAKAQFGQWLLDRAWHDARREGGDVKPWPWADTHPVARLTVPARGVDVLVLAGANGRTLAWAPGHLDGTAVPGTRGNAVVTAHRDTHFAFLRDLAPGDHIVAQARDGTTRSYEVETTFVADAKSLSLPADPLGTTLSLVTCFPFDAVDPGTPLRYAVIARGDGDATSTGPRAADASGSAGARAPAGPRPRSRG